MKENATMTADDQLLGIGLALVIVAAVLIFAMSGSVESAIFRADLMRLGETVGDAIRSLAGSLGL